MITEVTRIPNPWVRVQILPGLVLRKAVLVEQKEFPKRVLDLARRVFMKDIQVKAEVFSNTEFEARMVREIAGDIEAYNEATVRWSKVPDSIYVHSTAAFVKVTAIWWHKGEAFKVKVPGYVFEDLLGIDAFEVELVKRTRGTLDSWRKISAVEKKEAVEEMQDILGRFPELKVECT